MARHPSQIPNLVAQYEPYRQASYTGRNHKLVDFSGNGHHGDMGSVKGAMLLGADGLSIPGSTNHAASNYTTNPSATEIDVELDLALDDVVGPAYLASKADPTGQRSWDVYLFDRVYIRYSTDGTNMTSFSHGLSLASVVAPGERFTLRVQFNGSDNGQHWVKFFINGSQWGPTSSLEGTVSIFNGSTSLKVARATSNALSGRVFSMTVRDGIDGAIVANPDFTAAPIGAASFEDDAGNTWTINSSSYDSNDPVITSTGASFDGSDYVDRSGKLLYPAGDFTLFLAVTGASQDRLNRLWSENHTSGTGYVAVMPGSGDQSRLRVLFRRDSGAYTQPGDSVAAVLDSTPHTFAFSYRASDGAWCYYVDGHLDKQGTASIGEALTVNRHTIGSNATSGSYEGFFTGAIHALTEYQGVLTADEIVHLHDYYRAQLSAQNVTLPIGPRIPILKSNRLMLPQHIGHL